MCTYTDAATDRERRQYRRLDIELPLECFSTDRGPGHFLRTTTRNVGTGGLYFELELPPDVNAPKVDSRLHVTLTVPPGEGYFPYEGRVTSIAEVVRCDVLDSAAGTSRVGIAARLSDPLKLDF